jgi:hypothetical protein
MTIIRTQAQIADASTAVLVATYNALTGKSIKKFSSRGAGESQVANAIMAAQDRAGHLGVSKGAAPVAITVAEESAKNDAGATQEPAPVAPPKSLRAKLALAAGDASPNKPKAERATSAPRKTLTAVVSTGRGKFRLQAASLRGQIMAFVGAYGAGKAVPMDAIVAKFEERARGAVRLLMDRDHLEAAE